MAGLSRSTHDASATTVALSHVAADARGKRKRDRRSNAGPAVSPSALDGSAWAAVVSGCEDIRPGTSKQRREGIAPAERRGVALREKNAGEVDFRRCCPSSRSHCCACDGELARPAADEPGSGGRLRSATSIKKSEKIVQPREQPPIWSRTPDRPWAWLRASAQGRTSTPPPRLQWFQSLRWRHPRELAARGGCSKSPRVGRAATETRSPTDGGSTALDSFEHGGESRR